MLSEQEFVRLLAQIFFVALVLADRMYCLADMWFGVEGHLAAVFFVVLSGAVGLVMSFVIIIVWWAYSPPPVSSRLEAHQETPRQIAARTVREEHAAFLKRIAPNTHQEVLERLEAQRQTQQGDVYCAICCDSRPWKECSTLLPCMHQFCQSCLDKQFRADVHPRLRTRCALCRTAFETAYEHWFHL